MYMPRIAWTSLNTRCGINLRNLVDAAKKYESVDSFNNKEKILIYLCKNLLRSVNFSEQQMKNNAYLQPLNKINSSYDSRHDPKRYELNKLMSLMSDKPKWSESVSKPVYDEMKPNYKYDNSDEMITSNSVNRIKQIRMNNANTIRNFKNTNEFSNQDSYDFKQTKIKRVNFKNSASYNENTDKSDYGSDTYVDETQKSQDQNSRYFIIDLNTLNSINNSDTYFLTRKHSIYSKKKKILFNSNNYLTSPLDVLHTSINKISRKHLSNILASGYELKGICSSPNSGKGYDDNLDYFRLNEKIYKQIRISKSRLNLFAYNNRDKDEELNKLNNNKLKLSSKFWPNFTDNYLTMLYIFVKLLFLLSHIGQVFVLNHLIGNDFYMIGINFLKSFFYETEWPHLAIFPRMTLCEIYIREIGTVHPYLIQCVLRINLFNEVIFLIVWFWLLIVILITGLDFLFRCIYLLLGCSNCQRKLFALKYLELIHMSSANNQNFRIQKINLGAASQETTKINPNTTITSEKVSFSSSSDAKKVMGKFLSDERTSRKEQYRKTSNKGSTYTSNKSNENKLVDNKNHSNYQSTDTSDNQDERRTLINNKKTQQHSDLADLTDASGEQSEKDMFGFDEIEILIIASEEEEYELFEKFCETSFTNDTIFALNIVQQNVSSLIVSEIIENLWIKFKNLHFIISNETHDFIVRKLYILRDNKKNQLRNENFTSSSIYLTNPGEIEEKKGNNEDFNYQIRLQNVEQ
jgi:hypothetical protein